MKTTLQWATRHSGSVVVAAVMAVIFSVSFTLSGADVDRVGSRVDVHSFDGLKEILAEYLAFREEFHPLVVPTAEMAAMVEGDSSRLPISTWQNDRDWYWHFSGGRVVFDENSLNLTTLSHLVEVVVYEDMVSSQLIVLGVGEKGTVSEIGTVKSPAWPTWQDMTSIADELSKRRIVWHAKVSRSSDVARSASLQEADPEGGGGSMMMTWQGGSVEALQVVGMVQDAENVTLTVAYPDTFDENMDIFLRSDMSARWELFATNVLYDSENNFITWTTNLNQGSRAFLLVGIRDVDGDGLPNSWEDEYGMNMWSSLGTNGAAGDADIDGFTNLEEYEAGSDPNDPEDGAGPALYVNDATGDDSGNDGSYYQPFKTISKGIATAQAGDRVLVDSGVYMGSLNRDLDFNGKAIQVQSLAAASNTVINCEGAGRGFVFQSDEGTGSVLKDITIMGGFAQEGGAVYCLESSPSLKGCILMGNSADVAGGAIYIKGGAPDIRECQILANTAGQKGGGICAEANLFLTQQTPIVFESIGSSPVLRKCFISGNEAAEGGGIYLADSTTANPYLAPEDHHRGTPDIRQCTLTRNSSLADAALSVHQNIQLALVNCIIANNYAGGILHVSADTDVVNCTITGNHLSGTNVTVNHNGIDYYYSMGSGIRASENIYDQGEIVVNNSVIWGNEPAYHQLSAATSADHLEVAYSAHSDNFPVLAGGFNPYYLILGDGRITSDPLVTRDGHLQDGSPCEDGAHPFLTPGWDINGEPRPGDLEWGDMGADEFIDGDTDGIANWWEEKHFGDPTSAQPSGNGDGDSFDNLEEYEHSTNPYSGDTDGDSLNDDDEIYVYNTDPDNWDSDEDLIPDGDEVTYGFDPAVWDDLNADPDTDGLSTLDELRYGSDPSVTDTDGDTVDDGDEVDQGSDPNDDSDGGQAPPPEELVEIELTVGDHSGSHSERYNLVVGSITHMAPEFGKLATKVYKFRRGQSYPVTIQHAGTKLPVPDYDYTAEIEVQTLGDSIVKEDANGILGVHNESDEFYAAGKSAVLHIIKAEFDHAKVNTRNLTHADDDFPDYEHCVAEIWDSSREVNLEDFLTAESLTFKDYLDWYVDGTKQSSSILNYGSEPGNNEIKDYEVHVTVKDSSTICDRLILVIVPTSTEQAHNDWVTTWSANTAWLAELPAAYGSITFDTSGDPEDPEPGTCTNEYWEDSVATLDSYFHPGATYEMRSEETPGGHGHQACYNGPGGIITSGVAAGTADSHHKSDIITPSHRTEDVLPFVRAAQLDGNPVWVNDLFPFDLNRPMMYEGSHLQQYLQLRPPIPNSKPLLTPGTCAP